MDKRGKLSIQRGQAITFRLPSDTPDHIIRQMHNLKETEKRNFSSKIAEFVMDGVSKSITKERETITIPLPKQLSKEQRNWIKHSHSEALLGNIIHQLLADPLRATSILATLNSKALDIDEALYLQEDQFSAEAPKQDDATMVQPEDLNNDQENLEDIEDDLMHFDWDTAKQDHASEEEPQKEESVDDLLGGFLANMNK
ncbi:hypothetical protein [Mesobacillus harenae]|uniref:hypothetical protein n=1 Tax=Mesobacillus harenae TaxID=2213203 RepID=UPI001580B829|nr:hypothetical protein [Mesobacillus harenae]